MLLLQVLFFFYQKEIKLHNIESELLVDFMMSK